MKVDKLRQFSYCEKTMNIISTPLGGGTKLMSKEVEMIRRVGFKVGSSVCERETTVSTIEAKYENGFLIVDVYVCDRDNSEAKWKTITITQTNVCVSEYDWKKVIKCKSEK